MVVDAGVAVAKDLLGQGFEIVATATRDTAVAVLGVGLSESDDPNVPEAVKRLVIVELHDGEWRAPNVIGGTPSRTATRWARTHALTPFQDYGQSQSGWPDEDGRKPKVAWLAVTGVAARDVASVRLRSPIDNYEVTVGDDGRFLALLLAPWGAQAGIDIRTSAGEIRQVAP